MACTPPGFPAVDKNADPDPAAEVAMARPVFGVHTEFSGSNGNSPRDRPWRISSMPEFLENDGDEPGSSCGNELSTE